MKPAINGTELLNKVQSTLVAFASEKGINLQAEFGTVEKFRQFVIAFTLRFLVDAGLNAQEAFNAVMGANAFQSLAESVWSELNARAALERQPARLASVGSVGGRKKIQKKLF